MLDALPFLVRLLGRHRRDHDEIERSLTTVLLSDGGEDAFARGQKFATPVRQQMYALLTNGGSGLSRHLIDAALDDPDAVVRARAIRSVAAAKNLEHRAAILDRLMRDDSVPAVRRLALERAVPAAIAALADAAASVRSTALAILGTNASRVDFDTVRSRVRSLSDPEVRGSLLRVFLDAPKWDASVYLLEALMDPDGGVRARAAHLMDQWIGSFDRIQTLPTPTQVQRIGALLDSVASRISDETARMLRFSIKST